MFRKKPVEFEAFQMTEARRWDNSEWPNWLNQAWQKEPGEEGSLYIDGTDKDGTRLLVGLEHGCLPVNWGDYLEPLPGGGLMLQEKEAFEFTYESLQVDGPITPSIRDRICAGAVALLFGYLTTRRGVLKFGANEDCAPTALALREWADEGGVSLDVDAIFPGAPIPAEEPCPECKGTGQLAGAYEGILQRCRACLPPNTTALMRVAAIRDMAKRPDLTPHQRWLRTLKILGKEGE